MSGHINAATQSTLKSSLQNALYRNTSKSQVGSTTSNISRSPSPKPTSGTNVAHGLLAKGPPAPGAIRLSPTVGQFVLNTLLQVAGIVAAVAFGIYAVQSVTVGKGANQFADDANQLADDANRLAETANKLALLSLCLQSGNETAAVNSICSLVDYYVASVLPEVATSVFSGLPSAIPTSNLTIPPSNATATPPLEKSDRTGLLTGIVMCVLISFGAIATGLAVWIKRRRAQRNASVVAPVSAMFDEKEKITEGSMSIMQSFRRLFMETRVVTEP